MNRKLQWCATAAIAVLAMTGCVRTTVDTTISSDDTFSQHLILAFSDDVAGQIGAEAGADITSLVDELESEPEFIEFQERYPDQVTLQGYSDGELNGIELTISDLPLEEFNAATSQASTGFTEGATLTRVDDTFVVEMSVPEGADLDSLGVTESQLALLASAVDISVSYTFPGPIEEATAGTVDGHTVTLGIADLLSAQDVRIVGSAGDSINWQPILTWGGIALAFILVIGGATALIVQDRRKSRFNTLPEPTVSDDLAGPGMLPDPSIGDSEGEPKN